jgi:hypothetical protein
VLQKNTYGGQPKGFYVEGVRFKNFRMLDVISNAVWNTLLDAEIIFEIWLDGSCGGNPTTNPASHTILLRPVCFAW